MIAGKLTCNIDGEGQVKFSDDFLSRDKLYRADVLKDWLYDLIEEYNRARRELDWSPCHLERDNEEAGQE